MGITAGALPDILEPVTAVPEDNPNRKLDTSQAVEPLPLALPLASPERSAVDEENFNVCNFVRK